TRIAESGGEAPRSIRVHVRDHEGVPFEASETRREDVRRDSGHLCAELVEAARSVQEGLDHEQRPAVADAANGFLEGRRLALCHGGSVEERHLCIVTCNSQVSLRGGTELMGVLEELQQAVQR